MKRFSNARRSGLFLVVLAAIQACSGPLDSPAPTEPAVLEMASVVSGVTLVGAGDIATCSSSGDEATATLLDHIGGTVFTLGDNAYPDGSSTDFANCYNPTWGRHKGRTRPTVGNHDYQTAGAAGYFGYFGSMAGDPSKGYYSYNTGTWHVVVLNDYVPMAVGSAQEQWLRANLAANTTRCTVGMIHEPLWTSGSGGTSTYGGQSRPLVQALYDNGVDLLLVGHRHHYERFALQTPAGAADPVRGIREIVVGTGGEGHEGFSTPLANSEVRNGSTYGVLQLTLGDSAYAWKFVAVAGQTFSDSGTTPCHGKPGAPPPPPNQPPVASFTASCTNLSCTFTDGSSDPDGTVAAWSWNFGDATTSTTRSPSHSYAAAGTYSVKLTVTDNKGATGSSTKSVTVSAATTNQPPVANAGGPYSADDRVTFNGSLSSDPDGNTPLTYAWNFGDGTTGTGVTPAHTYVTNGTYTATLVVTDAKGASSAAAHATVTIANVPPTVHAGADVSMRPGTYTLNATFSDPGTTDAPWTYRIDWGDGTSQTGTTASQSAITASHSYVVPATYHVRVTVTDKDGGSGSDEALATVTLF